MCGVSYHFFDYKYHISGFTSDLFSLPHLVYIGLVFVLGFLVSWLLRKTERRNIDVLLKVLFFFTAVLEIVKISWESYYDITEGRGFNAVGLLPIYTCSLYIYTMGFAAFGRGRVKKIALAFLTTIGLLYGGIGVVYCNGLNFYPFWTFGAFYSLYFHSAMFVTGVFLLMTQYFELHWSDALWAMIPVVLLCLAAIPVNHALGSDYMLIYSGAGVPFYEDLAAWLASKGLRFVYTVIMMLTHIPLAGLVIASYKLIRAVFRRSVRTC